MMFSFIFHLVLLLLSQQFYYLSHFASLKTAGARKKCTELKNVKMVGLYTYIYMKVKNI